jgi:hypothetical protein
LKWLSTRDFSRLLEDHYPASEVKVREWCEEGLIPPEYAKRSISPKERGRWRIAAKGLTLILGQILGLSPSEIAEVQGKLKP